MATIQSLGADTLNSGKDKINNNFNALNQEISTNKTTETSHYTEVSNRISNLIIESGTSDAEIIDARGIYTVLKDRLDNVDLSFADMTQDYTVNLYVSTTGSDSNDGLSEFTPFATCQKAFDKIKENSYRTDIGSWIIQLASGTYSELDFVFSTPTLNRVVIKGADVGGHPNVPTTIFDGTGGIAYQHGMRISGIGVKAEIRDIKFQNFVGSSSRIGLVGENESDLFTNNVHADNCDWCGIYAFNTVRARIKGGILNACRSGFITNCTQTTIGYNAVDNSGGTIITNCTESGIYWSRGSQGHIDYCNLNDNAVALVVAENSRVDTVSNNFKRNVVGIRARTGGVFGEGGTPNIYNDGVIDANTTNVEYKAFSGDTSELAAADSYVRVACDRVTRTVTGMTPTLLATPYTIKSKRLQGTGKQCKIHILGSFTAVTAGSIVTVVIGGMSIPITVPALGTNVAFEIEITLMDVSGGYRAIGKMLQGLNGLRMFTATSGFLNTADQTITISATLAGSGDTINIYRTDVYLMG